MCRLVTDVKKAVDHLCWDDRIVLSDDKSRYTRPIILRPRRTLPANVKLPGQCDADRQTVGLLAESGMQLFDPLFAVFSCIRFDRDRKT